MADEAPGAPKQVGFYFTPERLAGSPLEYANVVNLSLTGDVVICSFAYADPTHNPSSPDPKGVPMIAARVVRQIALPIDMFSQLALPILRSLKLNEQRDRYGWQEMKRVVSDG